MGVNVPNFGPGTAPGLLRRWAQTVEGLGFGLLMISDHIAVTPAESPITAPGRLAGEGTIDQIAGDLAQLHLLGAGTVVLDPFSGQPGETLHPGGRLVRARDGLSDLRHLRE